MRCGGGEGENREGPGRRGEVHFHMLGSPTPHIMAILSIVVYVFHPFPSPPPPLPLLQSLDYVTAPYTQLPKVAEELQSKIRFPEKGLCKHMCTRTHIL